MTRLFDNMPNIFPESKEKCQHVGYANEFCPNCHPEDPYKEKAAKLRPQLLPVEATVEAIKAMEFGASKYGAHQWKTVDMPKEAFLDALERHLIAYKQGEKNAQDSGVSHLGHIIANCGILLARFDK